VVEVVVALGVVVVVEPGFVVVVDAGLVVVVAAGASRGRAGGDLQRITRHRRLDGAAAYRARRSSPWSSSTARSWRSKPLIVVVAPAAVVVEPAAVVVDRPRSWWSTARRSGCTARTAARAGTGVGGLPHEREGLAAILRARQVDHDRVALAVHLGLGDTEGVDAVGDDLAPPCSGSTDPTPSPGTARRRSRPEVEAELWTIAPEQRPKNARRINTTVMTSSQT